ncbi:MAG: sugar transferase [Thermaerobacter sp.]|nr:sugar transferase [Thermaerobacter sp.]
MYRLFVKRALDIVFAMLLLPFVGATLAFVGLLIWMEDGGPVFYNHERLGRDGILFRMYKLRTMRVNAPDIRNEDGSTFSSAVDPRLTRIGAILRRSSIDELPQIFNVLKGNMSFVGPRPDLPEHLGLYRGNEVVKLRVLPGITGYNQAFFRNTVEWKQRLKNDVYYAERLSCLLDMRVLLATIVGVCKQKGIFSTQSKREAKQ